MIPLVKVAMPARERLMPQLEEVLYSGMISEGEAVYAFERAFADHFGLPNALAMSSGTAALHAALTLAGVGPGDEVVTTPMTAEPTNVSILHVGARPVWADVDPASGNMDPESLEKRITDKTRAILVVHYAGYPVRLQEILTVARARNLPVIEDCAHALGARYAGQPVGTLADFAIFSLQAIKHMTTADGGILSIGDPSLVEQAKRFRWFGLSKNVPRLLNDITSVGYKYNMNNVAATIGLCQLETINDRVSEYIDNGRAFDAAFQDCTRLRPADYEVAAAPSFWLYTLLCDDSEKVQSHLESRGIAASKLHVRNDRHSIFEPSRRKLPNLDIFYDRFLHIPCGWWVDFDARGKIIEAVREADAL
jgi:perosamine synthetase